MLALDFLLSPLICLLPCLIGLLCGELLVL